MPFWFPSFRPRIQISGAFVLRAAISGLLRQATTILALFFLLRRWIGGLLDWTTVIFGGCLILVAWSESFSRQETMELQMAAAEVNILSLEVDFDYEFDASRYFDFVREEPPSEVWEAEYWFETAGSYPPSPFISKLVVENDVFAETVNTLPKFKGIEMPSFRSERAADEDLYDLDEISKAQNCLLYDPYQNEKTFVFGSSTRVSTLMKPTASHLAKQNNHRKVRYAHQSAHRLQKPLIEECVKNSEDPYENGVQAAKRQKLEGGILRQVVTEKQQIDLMHKIRENNNITSTCKLRLTIPREPELATAQRARRIRVHRSNVDQQSQELKTPVTSTFKTHPLNRKISEAPLMASCLKSTPRLPNLQNINSKMTERDFKRSVATSSSSIQFPDAKSSTSGRSSEHVVKSHLKCFQRQPFIASRSVSDDQRIHNDENILPKFTARPLNKKILSSKGDIGVFRCAKRETTKPMEFNLSSNKRCQQDLPTELFNKLSLNSDVPESSASLTTPLWPLHGGFRKGSTLDNKEIRQVMKVMENY